MRSSPFNQRLSIICLSLMLSATSFPQAFAQSSASIYEKLSSYENTLFGKDEKSLSIEKRLQNVEKVLFGKASKSGSTADRINAIEHVMSGKNEYLPPIAPELDRSEFAPTPKKAPDSADIQAVENEAPAAADNSDRVQGLLRQAMQSYQQGKTTDAERVFRQVLAIDFRNADANYNLGAIAESKGDLSSAGKYYKAALAASPADADIKDAYKSVEEKLKKQAVASSTAAPALSGSSQPAVPDTAMAAGDRTIATEAAAAYKKGNFDDAIAKLSYLARKNPYDANTQFALGQAYRGKGNTQEALRHLRSAATLDTKNDLYVKALNDLQSDQEDQQAGAASPQTAQAKGGGSQDVQPFVGLPQDNSSSGSSSDLSAVENYLRRNAGGSGMMIGSVSGYGSGGMGSPFGSMGGIPMMGTAAGGTRLRRVMTSSLAGAAMGAMSNRGYPGGMSKGAMRGAMYGGLFGLMLGGY
ncbi:MAG: tetratricopeptide repeat protein [Candidatus Obscuribacterales bacterium]|nr:tetratricopeptide repeat protein [Candidatus Obscuribacterales bacterium]